MGLCIINEVEADFIVNNIDIDIASLVECREASFLLFLMHYIYYISNLICLTCSVTE